MLDKREDKEVSSEDPIFRLALATASEIGDEFLASLVRSLHDVMPVSLAFIARSSGDPATHASAVFSWLDGDLGVPIEYELEGTPCKLLYGGKTLVIPSDLRKKFPEKERHESYCGVPLPGRDGEIRGHFAVFSSDVVTNPLKVEGIVRIFGMRAATELQRLEIEAEREAMVLRLDEQRAALHKANTFKSSVIGMVAHDLRNPLTTIVSRTELVRTLLSKPLAAEDTNVGASIDGKVEKSLTTVLRSADRMSAMINDLLDAAKVELASVEIRKSPSRLSAPVTTAIELINAEARAKNIQIKLDARGDGIISIDETRMTEVMVNILTNAVKYSLANTEITVSFDLIEDNRFAQISIRDEGLGMSQADIDLAFQPFQILSAKPTAGEGSTGLGLVIVKSVVEAHGGTVRIASDGIGTGTEFSIRLPC